MRSFKIIFFYLIDNISEILDVSVFSFLLLWNSFVVMLSFPAVIAIFFIFIVINVVEAGVKLFKCMYIGDPNFFLSIKTPYLYIHRFKSYLDSMTDYSSTAQGSSSEDFFPPFLFGFRDLFRGRIIGWKGTWASYLRLYRRRIKSSISEWGYKNRAPTHAYYTLRGGTRIKIFIPNNFKRITGTSYSNPLWLYRFPPYFKRYGYERTLWYRENYIPFRDIDDRRINRVHRELNYRLKWWYLRLRPWVEQWAPSLDPKYTDRDAVLAMDRRSPYSYYNFRGNGYEHPGISFGTEEGSKLGVESTVIYRTIIKKDRFNPWLAFWSRDISSRAREDRRAFVRNLNAEKKVGEIAGYVLIDKKFVRLRSFKIAYTLYGETPFTEPKSDRAGYPYLNYVRSSIYQLFTEFFGIFFEAIYVYPFEFGVVDIPVVMKNDFFEGINFFEFLDFDFMSFPNMFFVVLAAYLYFILFIGLAQTVKVAYTSYRNYRSHKILSAFVFNL